MKSLYLLVAILLLGQYCSARYYMPASDALDEAKSKQLIVITHFEGEGELKTLSDEDKKKTLEVYHEEYVRAVKYIFPKYWNISSKEVLYYTLEEFNDLSEDEKVNSITFMPYFKYYKNVAKSGTYQGQVMQDAKIWTFAFKKYYIKEGKLKTRNLFVTPIDCAFPSYIEIFTSLKTFIYHATKSHEGVKTYKELFNIDETKELMSKKTLLVDETLTKLSKEVMEKAYGGDSIIICNEDDIINYISTNPDNYLLLKLTWGTQKATSYYNVFDLSDGRIISVVALGGLKVALTQKEPNFSLRNPTQAEQSHGQHSTIKEHKSFTKVQKMHVLYRSPALLKKMHVKALKSKMQKINW